MYSTHPDFVIPSKEVEKRIDEIISKLTLEEKIKLIGGEPPYGHGTNPIPEKNIPQFRMSDGPMGVHWWTDKSTSYPALIGLAATWNPELIYSMGKALGRDCRARGIHILLAPGVNIYRSPLCGRNFEYFGEDPFLASKMSTEYIKGVQSERVSATVKHFAVNFQEYDRHNVSSDVDERTLHEIYLPAFKQAVTEAGVGCVMTSYNLVNGVHTSESELLIKKILKGMWKFDGVVMSDWVSTYSAIGAANAGLDLEMPFAKWMNTENLIPAIKENKVSLETIDDKVRRLLRLAICFGWLDKEQKDPSIPLQDPESEKIALNAARESIVLLKNTNNFLPLDISKIKKLAIVGSNAHPAVIGGGGSAWNNPTKTVSILDGFKHICKDKIEILYAPGYIINRESTVFKNSVFTTLSGEDGVLAEYFDNLELKDKPVLTRIEKNLDIFLGGVPPSDKITSERYSARWTGKIISPTTEEYTFYIYGHHCGLRLFLNDNLVVDRWNEGEKNGIFRETINYKLEANQSYKIRLELKRISGWTHSHCGWEPANSFYKDKQQALEICRQADAVICCAGFNQHTESEGFDRPFAMEKGLEDFIIEVASINPKTVVVCLAGGNVDMNRWIDKIKALVYAWYPGQEGGLAVAEVILGLINPSGKLPATFEKRLEDRSSFSCYHDDDNDKHVELKDGIFTGYRHFDKYNIEPRFPFGFGLSYTNFEYKNIKLSSNLIKKGGYINVEFEVKNTGNREGAEVCQLYIKDKESSLPRPVKELKGFKKVFLKKGESKKVSITINDTDLMFFDPVKYDWVVEEGEFEILIGSSATDIRLKDTFKFVE